MEEARTEYQKPEINRFFVTSSVLEHDGYCQWPRLKETVVFCQRMGYKRIGLAFCIGPCQGSEGGGGSFKKERPGGGFRRLQNPAAWIRPRPGSRRIKKLNPGAFEAMCNPILQAKLLNEQKTELNIALGLCVGHDSLFYRYSDAMVTTLVAKDRVLAHNPVGAIYCAEGYFKNRL